MGKQKPLALTITLREPIFLPKWCAYYSQWFALYILDQSSDGWAETWANEYDAEYEHFPILPSHGHGMVGDNRWQHNINKINRIREFYLDARCPVLFADTDEYLLPDPNTYAHLGEYVERMERDFVYSIGFEIPRHASEPEIDWDLPALHQRAWWVRNELYGKPHICRTYAELSLGGHYLHGRKYQKGDGSIDRELYTFHLRPIDGGERNLAERKDAWEPMPHKFKYCGV
jgi:hypothetical protein